MKKLVVLLTVALFATSAMAQIDGDDNSFGIYFDEGATQVGIDYFANPANIYMVLANPTVDAVGGFGLDLSIDIVTGFAGYWVPFGPNNLSAPGSMVTAGENIGVAYATPIAVTGPTVTLMATTGAFFGQPGTGHIHWRILPGTAGPPSQIGLIALLDGDGNIVPGVDSANGGVCAWLGEGDVVATEEATFGSVKALYR